MAEHSKNPNATKRGPGRYHSEGHQKASPIPQRGAPMGFVQHTNPEKNSKRKLKRSLGARKLRIMVKLMH